MKVGDTVRLDLMLDLTEEDNGKNNINAFNYFLA